MALTAFPTILVNSGTGSDTAASGAGPGTAVTGTCNTVTNSTTVTFAGAPDLSGVATDGSAVLQIDGIGFVRISTTDNVGKSVVVETAVTVTAGTNFAIGGKRATLDHTETRRLFAATSSPTAVGASGQWIIELEDDQPVTSTITLAFTVGTGFLTIRSNNTTLRVISSNVSGGAVFTTATSNRYILDTIKIQHTHATVKGYAFTSSGAAIAVLRNCVVGDSAGTNCPSGLWTRTGSAGFLSLYNTSVLRCGSIGITGSTDVYMYGSEVSRCGGAGISNAGGRLGLYQSIISHNSGDGVNNSTVTGTGYTISGCTIHGNTGDGIEFSGNNSNGQVVENCNLTANGGYGIRFSGTTPNYPFVDYNNFGNASDSTNNTSGTVTGFTLNSTNLTVACGYPDASAGTRNFAPGTSIKAAGFPPSTATMAAAQTGSTNYTDIGAVQAQATGGGTVAYGFVG